ncbi:hypothetical protein HYR99_03775 [Candidatus Poribacteria bacterium]|nr:hypothetical protein [Candidatus Poribacteria bacterium]
MGRWDDRTIEQSEGMEVKSLAKRDPDLSGEGWKEKRWLGGWVVGWLVKKTNHLTT